MHLYEAELYASVANSLVAYCQRNGLLSRDSSVVEEIMEICDISKEQAEEILDIN